MTHHDLISLKRAHAKAHAEFDAIDATVVLSAADQQRFDRLHAEIRRLDLQIEQAERAHRAKAASAVGSPASLAAGLPAQSARATGRMTFRAKNGELITALGAGDPWPVARNDLPDADFGEVSIGRAIRAAVTGDWSGADAEREMVRASMATNSSASGGFLVPSPMAAQIIDLARAKAQVIAAGAQVIPMTSNSLTIASLERDPEAGWRGEGAPVKRTEATFGSYLLSTRTLAAIITTSVELLEDAANIDGIVRDALAQSMALAWDRAALSGSGIGPEPKGVLNVPTIQTQDESGGDLLHSYTPFSQAYGKLLAANVDENAVSVLYNSDVSTCIDQAVDSTGQPLRPPPSWAKIRPFVTNQLTTANNRTNAVMGDFSNLMLGVRRDITIEATRVGEAKNDDGSVTSAFGELKVLIRAYMRGDVCLVRDQQFINIKGLKVTD